MPIWHDSYAVLKVRCGLAIVRTDGPPVGLEDDLTSSHSHHRLYADTHTCSKLGTKPWMTIVGDVWILVHLMPDTMPHEFTDDTIALCLTVTLDCRPNMPDIMTFDSLLDT